MVKLDKSKALVVFSGGQDSTTCLGHALSNYDQVCLLTFDYGQLHKLEVEAAQKVRSYFEEQTNKYIPHEILKLNADAFKGMSPLINKNQELETYLDHDQMAFVIGDRVEKTFVPMRNALFLTYAANRAAVEGIGIIVTGVCQADNANYPDCTKDFITSMQITINEALGLDAENGIFIDTPLITKTKAESIHYAMRLPYTYDALAYSHTAYDGKYPPTGKDHASVLRAYGFEEAGVPDPLVMRAFEENLMELPTTSNYDKVR